MEKKRKDELMLRQREITSELGALYEAADKAKRELTADEKVKEAALSREFEQVKRELSVLFTEAEAARNREQVNKGQQFRELLKGIVERRESREILLNATGENVTANIEASGAIQLHIQDLIPTLHEGLGLPKGLKIVTDVTGNELYPVSVNDVTLEEVGETVSLNDQVLDFDKIVVTPHRVGASIPISRHAIENAAFDLLGFVQGKITLATKLYLARKVFSHLQFDGNHGPFEGNPKKFDLFADGNEYQTILELVAGFCDKGFAADGVCLCMDATMEARLKATPKIEGAAGGFVIENGLCAGYPYVVSHFVGEMEYAGQQKFQPGTALAIGYFDWFALQQHDKVSLIVDATSSDVAMKNIVRVIFNTWWSMTDLSTKINGADGASQAFAWYCTLPSDSE